MPGHDSIPKSVAILALALALSGCSDLGVKVKLRGQFEVSATALDFGTLALNDVATRTVTVRNIGNASLAGDATASCAGFLIIAGGGPFTLAPGGARDIMVQFSPVSPMSYFCGVDLGAGNPGVVLVGAGANQLPGAAWTVVPTTLDFGTVAKGQSAFRTITITSTGTDPVTVNVVSPCPEYLPVTGGGAAVIAPGNSLTVNLLFNPLAGGTYPCSIALGPGIAAVLVTAMVPSVSYQQDIQPIWTQNCTRCHDVNSGNGGLFLDGGLSYGQLVGKPSQSYPPAVRIVPFDTTNSVLYVKITKQFSQFGGGMPQGAPPLPRTLIDKIKTWILEGALNN